MAVLLMSIGALCLAVADISRDEGMHFTAGFQTGVGLCCALVGVAHFIFI